MKKQKNSISCFSPVADESSCVLILGSVPSVKSLFAGEYYAHPQNAFWFIMSELFDFDRDLEYEKRLNILLKNRVALFDVINTCERKGSLDSDIKEIEHQDFEKFFQKFPNIDYIFCNGTKAYDEFLKIYRGSKKVYRLPSTSPANARMKKEDKLKTWKKIQDVLCKYI